MDGSRILAGESVSFASSNGRSCTVRAITDTDYHRHADAIRRLGLLIIPESGDVQGLIRSQSTGWTLAGKTDLSVLVFDDALPEPIGLVVAYPHSAGKHHPFDALHVAGTAIAGTHQRVCIGTRTLRTYLADLFAGFPWLLNVSVSAPDTKDDEGLMRFYERVGFKRFATGRCPAEGNRLLWLCQDTFGPQVREALGCGGEMSPPGTSINHWRLGHIEASPCIFFSTTSEKKYQHFKFLFNCYNIRLDRTRVLPQLIEPQVDSMESIDEIELVRQPLKIASRFIAKSGKVPFLIEDTMLFIEFFNRDYDHCVELPGHDTKRWWHQLGAERLIELMGETRRRRARFVSQIGAFYKREEYLYARGSIEGRIADMPRVSMDAELGAPATSPWFFHQVFIPDGSDLTLAEMDADVFAEFDYRRRCVENLLSTIKLRFGKQLLLDFS